MLGTGKKNESVMLREEKSLNTSKRKGRGHQMENTLKSDLLSLFVDLFTTDGILMAKNKIRSSSFEGIYALEFEMISAGILGVEIY